MQAKCVVQDDIHLIWNDEGHGAQYRRQPSRGIAPGTTENVKSRPRRPRQLYIVSLLQLFSSLRQLTEGLLLVSRIASRLSCVFQIASMRPHCKSTSRPAGRELTPGRKITSTEYNLRVVNKTGTICGIHSSSPKPSQIHTPFIYIVHDITNSHSIIITSH